MVVVAIAGATGGVGKTVIEEIHATAPHHKVYVLGRNAPSQPTSGSVEFLKVDYSNVESLTKVLEDHAVDTIISTINLETDAGSEAQLGLIAAADKSKTTRRFIPSEFVSYIDEDDPNSGPGMGGWVPNARALKKTSLEYIRISVGFFTDYWGIPNIKTSLRPFRWFIDMEKGEAAIPGTGDERFTVTYSVDLAKAIVKLLDMQESWPKHGHLSGSDVTLNELVAHAEKLQGSKFKVVYDPQEKLERGEVTLLWTPDEVPAEEFKVLFLSICQLIVSGACILPQDGNQLTRIFPDLRLTTAQEILTEAWGGQRLTG
ncbi:hypothetical protein NUW58_g2870 [Xylaria curta]|uniref:Uncharacterized protein n=1 Tax=Xylaria curta TaxID=42375 RepID=A0ACC1PDH9_9PEZI|nr:hypothetical protein NUW58_g2870 [Xylaria curta]